MLNSNWGNDTLAGGAGTDLVTDFELGRDCITLGSSLQFNDPTFSGHSILQREEVLADLNEVNPEQLTSNNFDSI